MTLTSECDVDVRGDEVGEATRFAFASRSFPLPLEVPTPLVDGASKNKVHCFHFTNNIIMLSLFSSYKV